ncbi:FAD-binding oxidoreductase [Nocardia sp. NRRL S-836]|uniref:FAD-binding oxidoreductase n=1 Tax=Nocardia sp. NRRL S-836 TaxID=1519492 RepID=UPI0006ADAD08|nr:FAD-binding oxidoreductase [Nocardia sp. NRRL S-836]KOV82417.1 FAD-linked oxidase [Nocardia sp. NRRL S-836]
MTDQSRRKLLLGAAAVPVAAAVSPLLPGTAIADDDVEAPNTVVTPGDRQYADLVIGSNARFVASPRQVHVPGSAAQVVRSVQAAVDAGLKVVVRSGGHCSEDFVHSPSAQVIIDLSELNEVGFDPVRGAFFVEPGAGLGEVYRTLYKKWGVTVPGGLTPTVGAGGHVAGGGYGRLSRQYGSSIDHLCGVEVVVVDTTGRARTVTATNQPSDPHRDLWWAHTGGGGGNFGVVTRYWFRSPGATGNDPSTLLPKPPKTVVDSLVRWSWADMSREAFRRLLRNHGRWHELNSAPGSPHSSFYSLFTVLRKNSGVLDLNTTLDGTLPDADRLLAGYLAALNDGVGVPFTHDVRRDPWLKSTLLSRTPDTFSGTRAKLKAAYLRKALPDRELDVIYDRLTGTGYTNPVAGLLITSYGGQVNAVPSTATAQPQRDSVNKVVYVNSWNDPAEDAEHLRWIREFYRDVHAGTGGVPVPGELYDGSYINYADVDLADPAWNTSGVPWHALYYKGNYARLQQVKARWDPRDVFNHALSVRLPR